MKQKKQEEKKESFKKRYLDIDYQAIDVSMLHTYLDRESLGAAGPSGIYGTYRTSPTR